MPDPITPAERAEWRRLEAAATRGEWSVKRRWSNECEVVPRIVCKPDDDRECGWIADCVGAPYLGHKSTLPNAALIVVARNNFTRLLDALDAAEAQLAESARSWADDHTHLQYICRAAGIPEQQVSGDSHGVPGIGDLADMLAAKLAEVTRDRDALVVALKDQTRECPCGEYGCPTCDKSRTVLAGR